VTLKLGMSLVHVYMAYHSTINRLKTTTYTNTSFYAMPCQSKGIKGYAPDLNPSLPPRMRGHFCDAKGSEKTMCSKGK